MDTQIQEEITEQNERYHKQWLVDRLIRSLNKITEHSNHMLKTIDFRGTNVFPQSPYSVTSNTESLQQILP